MDKYWNKLLTPFFPFCFGASIQLDSGPLQSENELTYCCKYEVMAPMIITSMAYILGRPNAAVQKLRERYLIEAMPQDIESIGFYSKMAGILVKACCNTTMLITQLNDVDHSGLCSCLWKNLLSRIHELRHFQNMNYFNVLLDNVEELIPKVIYLF